MVVKIYIYIEKIDFWNFSLWYVWIGFEKVFLYLFWIVMLFVVKNELNMIWLINFVFYIKYEFMYKKRIVLYLLMNWKILIFVFNYLVIKLFLYGIKYK